MSELSKKSKFEKCSDCGGTGMVLNYCGDPDECSACGGDTVVELSEQDKDNETHQESTGGQP